MLSAAHCCRLDRLNAGLVTPSLPNYFEQAVEHNDFTRRGNVANLSLQPGAKTGNVTELHIDQGLVVLVEAASTLPWMSSSCSRAS